MPDDFNIPFTKIRIGKFLFLLISLLLMFALRPFLEGRFGMRILMDIFISVIILSGIYAASRKKTVFYGSLAIAAPTLIVSWANYFVAVPFSLLLGKIFNGLFFLFMILIILNYLFKEKKISTDLIMGSICVYLLIGLVWASVFAIMEITQPGSFKIPGEIGSNMSTFSYYSFVTITTLGYGDITPISAPARSLSVLEAIIGQLYIAILVARLVGIHIAQSMDKTSM
jgi:ion channel